jgi:hypothetical protein
MWINRTARDQASPGRFVREAVAGEGLDQDKSIRGLLPGSARHGGRVMLGRTSDGAETLPPRKRLREPEKGDPSLPRRELAAVIAQRDPSTSPR